MAEERVHVGIQGGELKWNGIGKTILRATATLALHSLTSLSLYLYCTKRQVVCRRYKGKGTKVYSTQSTSYIKKGKTRRTDVYKQKQITWDERKE
mgnify:CR=1 FL=1